MRQVEKDPSDEHTYSIKANEWKEKGDTFFKEQKYKEAIECYDKAIKLDPDNSAAHCNKGDSLSQLGEYEEAIECYDKAISLDPDFTVAYYMKGRSLHELGKYEDSIEYYDRAIELDPDYVEAYYSKGAALYELPKYKEAIGYYEKAISLDPDFTVAYYMKGRSLYKLAKYERAIECYDKAISLDPEYVAAYYNKGLVLSTLGKYEEAIVCYDRAIELDPDYVEAYCYKGDALCKLEKYAEAIVCYDRAIELDPDYVEAYYSKGAALYELDRYKEAIECYDKVIELDPDCFAAYHNKGMSLSELDRYKEAIECYDKVIKLKPDSVMAYRYKDKALKLVRVTEAQQYWNQAIRINSVEKPKDLQRSFVSLVKMATAISEIVQTVLNPPKDELPSISFSQESISQGFSLISEGLNPSSLLSRSSELVVGSASSDPQYKTSELQTLQELMIRAAMHLRPEHFSPLAASNEVSSDTTYSICVNVLKDVTGKDGPLDGWLELFKKKIDENVNGETTDQVAATKEFVDVLGKCIRYIGSDSLNDPKADPLNKYVDPKSIDYLKEAEIWLENNHKHPDYFKCLSAYYKCGYDIKDSRMQAIKEGMHYTFSLLKRMEPGKYEESLHPEELILQIEKEIKVEEYNRFIAYIEEKYSDITDPNYLKNFWEEIYRNQYGSVCYKVWCESFKEEFSSSPGHQILQKIMAVHQIDIINKKPQVAMSRMPDASTDGLSAPNFGYRMDKSLAYKNWLKNNYCHAIGDIVMDSFHIIVDIGKDLDIEEFERTINIVLSNGFNDAPTESYRKYEPFVIPFALFLLEKVFKRPFKSYDRRNVSEEIFKAAAESNVSLTEVVQMQLEGLKSLAVELSTLRPGFVNGEKGRVFGVGFNGKKFDSPSLSGMEEDNSHVVSLSFSHTVRKKESSYLFLELARHIMETGSLISGSLEREHLASQVNKYKSLMLRHLKARCSNGIEKSLLTPTEYGIEEEERLTRYKEFILELEQEEISFDKLSPDLQAWVMNLENWYFIPYGVKIQAPDSMPSNETVLQEKSRELLFDAVAQPDFSKKHPEMVPWLFLNWKQELISLVADSGEVIRSSSKFEDLPHSLQERVCEEIDKLTGDIKPILREFWEESIEEKFARYRGKEYCKDRQNRLKLLQDALQDAMSKRDKYKKALEKVASSNSIQLKKLEDKLEKAEQEIKEADQAIEEFPGQFTEQLPSSRHDLSKGQYDMFKEFFFKDRNVSQCIEPVFSRVVKHDHFYPVFVSSEPGREKITDPHTGGPLQLGNKYPQDVIPPCGDKCQHNVLGHLYTADMLSYMSADKLDYILRIHNVGEVEDKFLAIKKIEEVWHSLFTAPSEEGSGNASPYSVDETIISDVGSSSGFFEGGQG